MYFNLLQPPTSITAYTGAQTLALQARAASWSSADIVVETRPENGVLTITVRAEQTPLERIHLRWNQPVPVGLRYLGDHWERAYGDLEWRGLFPERILPWYFLAHDGPLTHGYGVKTQPGALCFWMVDEGGVNLWLDVRCGGAGVELRGRALPAAQVVTRQGQPGETPFAAARAFCKLLCDAPLLPAQPVYGSNNWYYAYGFSNQDIILEDTRLLADLAPSGDNRPFMVIDAGWQPVSGDSEPIQGIVGGPYTGSNRRFPDMAALAERMRAMGVRPGIWIRPLAAYPDDPPTLLLPVERAVDSSAKVKVMDPSIPEVLERITADFRKLRDWGYQMIKHDWATCDLFGRWGFQMGAALTKPGWRFQDTTRTTAEITLALYRAIRAGAGDALVIGCNTMGHLGAGLFEIQRTGDDTSGREWERSRKYGINTLAFRAAQHQTFFAADPDCVGCTPAIPWEYNRQMLDLYARSGQVLFVSIDPRLIRPEERQAIQAAYAAAAQPQPLGEPLDWLDNAAPSAWRLGQETTRYDWYGAQGVKPLTPSIPIWWG